MTETSDRPHPVGTAAHDAAGVEAGLARRVDAALRAVGADPAAGARADGAAPAVDAQTYLAAAAHVFADVLRADCSARTSAIDLLVVDALVTYAFERAADDPATVEEYAARAMATLAGMAAPLTAPTTAASDP